VAGRISAYNTAGAIGAPTVRAMPVMPAAGRFKADHDGNVHATGSGGLNGDIVKVDSISVKGETK